MRSKITHTTILKQTFVIFVIIASFFIPQQTLAASKVKVNSNFNLKLAGLKLGSVGLAANLSKKSYSISIRAFTTGSLDRLMTFTIEARARGKFNGIKLNSTEYITAYSNKKVKRKVTVKYPDNNRASVNAKPKYKKYRDSIPLHAKHLRNVVDPLGGMILPFNKKYAPTDQQQCNRSQSVFDGLTNYKLVMTPIKKSNNSNGLLKNAIACQVRYQPIAGHRKSQKIKFSTAKVWLLPIGKANTLLPVKVTIPTQFGTFEIMSQKINIDGSELKFN